MKIFFLQTKYMPRQYVGVCLNEMPAANIYELKDVMAISRCSGRLYVYD